LTAVQQSVSARLFISEPGDPGRLRSITSGRGEGSGAVSFLHDGRLVFADQLSEGWIVNADGSDQKPLPLERRTAANVRACGTGSIVFERIEQRAAKVYIADLGSGAERLVTSNEGEQAWPACSPDGGVVFYSANGIQRIEASGGTPTRLAERAHMTEVSPDGTRIVYHRLTAKGETLVLASAVDGTVVRELSPTAPNSFKWHPSGRALIVAQNERGVDNLWELPIDGTAKRQLTQFTDDTIFRFDVGRDGRLAISRGRITRDVVLMTMESR
jgi:Tol biopolymer transport system component